jgi:tetratricopeptide (TPR) repeat protein
MIERGQDTSDRGDLLNMAPMRRENRVSDQFISVESEEDVLSVLSLERVSFEQMVACARALRKSRNFDLRERVARRTIELVTSESRPTHRARNDLQQAARIVTTSVIARAQSLEDVPGSVLEAHRMLEEGAKGSPVKLTTAVFSGAERKLADLTLYLDNSSPRSLVSAGSLLRDQQFERPDLAIEAADLALQTEPKNIAALNVKGSALSDLESFEDALDVLNSARALEPRNRFVLPAYSRALEGVGQVDEAIAVAELVLEMWPDNEAAIRRLLTLYKNSRQFEEFGIALEHLKSLSPREPKRDQWVELLAVDVLLDAGDFAGATQAFEAIHSPISSYNKKLFDKIQKRLKAHSAGDTQLWSE